MSRECRSCGVVLVAEENWSPGNVRKNNYKCKHCSAYYQRQYYHNNREDQQKKNRAKYKKNSKRYLAKQKVNYIRKTFGITEEEYNRYLENPCSICNKNDDLVLDHCHSSGSIRGVLCRQCNAALGLFKDSFELLKKAEEYLRANDKTVDH